MTNLRKSVSYSVLPSSVDIGDSLRIHVLSIRLSLLLYLEYLHDQPA